MVGRTRLGIACLIADRLRGFAQLVGAKRKYLIYYMTMVTMEVAGGENLGDRRGGVSGVASL